MNNVQYKRIMELSEQAIEDMPGAWNIPDEFCKKFAELIVQECCQIVLDCSIPGSNNERDFVVTVREIKQHFGVEDE